jgi:hypothetical protein
MGSQVVEGVYVDGAGHSRCRPKFYESLGMRQGSINIQLTAEKYDSLALPINRVQGVDQIDLEANQDFLVRRCRLKGTRGYQILPIDKTTCEPRGRHSEKVIEITLTENIQIAPKEKLKVELEEIGLGLFPRVAQ